MLSILAALVTCLANPSSAHADLDFFQLGGCKPGATVRFAPSSDGKTSCANAWPTSHYPSWGPAHDDDEPYAPVDVTPTRLTDPRGGGFTVVQVSLSRRMVQIRTADKRKLWVNADALDCDPKYNVSTYEKTLTTSLATRSGCTTNEGLPIDPKELSAISAPPLSDLGVRITEKARNYQDELRESVSHDVGLLNEAFLRGPLTAEEQYAALRDAQAKLEKLYQRASRIYGPDCATEDFGSTKVYEISAERGQRACRSLRYAHNAFHQIFDGRDMQGALQEFAARASFSHYFEGEQLQKVLADDKAFGAAMFSGNPTNNELFTRMASYFALGLEKTGLTGDSCTLKSSLYLINRHTSDFASMETALGKPAGGTYDEIHNGYLYGATGQPGDPIECAGFALRYILGMKRQPDPNGGKGSMPAVEDFNNIYRSIAAKTRPYYFGEYRDCFQIVDLRKGELPAPGDFVSTGGHITIVEKFDAENMRKGTISTIEAASGTCGSVCQMERPLFEPSCSTAPAADDAAADTELGSRPLRSDLRIMRYAPRPGRSCPIKMEGPSAPRSHLPPKKGVC